MSPVFAIDINQNTFAPARIVSISSILNVVIPLALISASLLLLAMLFIGGYKILTSGGSSENVEKGQQLLLWAVVGYCMVGLSFFLTKLIGFITNVAIPL